MDQVSMEIINLDDSKTQLIMIDPSSSYIINCEYFCIMNHNLFIIGKQSKLFLFEVPEKVKKKIININIKNVQKGIRISNNNRLKRHIINENEYKIYIKEWRCQRICKILKIDERNILVFCKGYKKQQMIVMFQYDLMNERESEPENIFVYENDFSYGCVKVNDKYVAGCYNLTQDIVLVNFVTGNIYAVFEHDSMNVKILKYKNNKILTISNTGIIRIWDIETKKCFLEIDNPTIKKILEQRRRGGDFENCNRSTCIFKNDNLFMKFKITYSDKSYAILINLQNGELIKRINFQDNIEHVCPYHDFFISFDARLSRFQLFSQTSFEKVFEWVQNTNLGFIKSIQVFNNNEELSDRIFVSTQTEINIWDFDSILCKFSNQKFDLSLDEMKFQTTDSEEVDDYLSEKYDFKIKVGNQILECYKSLFVALSKIEVQEDCNMIVLNESFDVDNANFNQWMYSSFFAPEINVCRLVDYFRLFESLKMESLLYVLLNYIKQDLYIDPDDMFYLLYKSFIFYEKADTSIMDEIDENDYNENIEIDDYFQDDCDIEFSGENDDDDFDYGDNEEIYLEDIIKKENEVKENVKNKPELVYQSAITQCLFQALEDQYKDDIKKSSKLLSKLENLNLSYEEVFELSFIKPFETNPIFDNIDDKKISKEDIFSDCLKKIYKNNMKCFNLILYTNDGYSIKVHKEILIKKSNFFFRMFKFGGEESFSKKVLIIDFSGERLKSLVEFIYLQKIESNDFLCLFNLLNFAEVYFEYPLRCYLIKKIRKVMFFDIQRFTRIMKTVSHIFIQNPQVLGYFENYWLLSLRISKNVYHDVMKTIIDEHFQTNNL